MPLREADAEKAERRWQRWRSQPPFLANGHFTQRLAQDGLHEELFRYLLVEPGEAVRNRLDAALPWLTGFTQAWMHAPADAWLAIPEAIRMRETAGFLYAAAPLIDQARARVREGVQALVQRYSTIPFAPDTIDELLCAILLPRLQRMLTRTLVLELNVARLQGLLDGETPQERFLSFTQRLRCRENALAILQEYPVLARQLAVGVEQWIAFSLEFLTHLCQDWTEICRTFHPAGDLDRLVELQADAGDSHRGGRSVLIARFSSGWQLVYKPKPLAVDAHFQQLLTWLNHRGDHPPFRTLQMLARPAYGWVEFVAAESCASPEEIRRFYLRQGGYLALLYALEATDLHFENLIAAGEHPVLVDLETLFHPRIVAVGDDHAGQLANQALYDSALRVGLLPQRFGSHEAAAGIDISGLGATGGQLTPFAVPNWEHIATDEMRFARKQVEIPEGHNQPRLNGAHVHIPDYAGAIEEGFSQVYRLLLRHRDELLAEAGPLARFAEDEVRVVLRPTQSYSLMLYESSHPDVLRDALDREQLFDRLWAGIEYAPHLLRTIAAERADLWNNDIPLFRTRPNAHDLWTSTGERIPGFFVSSGMTQVQRRIQQLGEGDLERQRWFVRASLATLSSGATQTPRSAPRRVEPAMSAERARLLDAACAIGDRLETLALRQDGEAAWLGLTLGAQDSWSLVPLGLDLYSGLPGVILFLAYLGARTGETRYTELAQAALKTMRRHMAQSKPYLTAIGAFTGWGGVIYTLTHLGSLWNQPDLLAEAEALVNLVSGYIEQDETLDIIGGAAGCIGSLLCLYRCAPSEHTLAAAVQCGTRLLARAQAMPRGSGWAPVVPATGPLTGFSHGAAGMAWALLQLAALTGELRFRTTALAAIAYERSLYVPEANNWPDLRKIAAASHGQQSGEDPCMTAWCHGAPGIGLARLSSLPYLDDAVTRAEIGAALTATLAAGFGGNHSICHGDLGNVELLLQAGQALGDPQWQAEANRIAARVLADIQARGWLCGVPLEVESPGLMIGIAGIGYGLLRLADPALVPSVLMLEPPYLGRRD
jgi:type 2 lantibiotic biosynthesis protein LanM